MANSINATSTNNGGLITTGDDSGVLNIQTNETTAISIDASQKVAFTNNANLPNTFGFKNRIINGAMNFNQRALTPYLMQAETGKYLLDRYYCNASQANKLTISRTGSIVPTGYDYAMSVTVTSAATIGAGDYFTLNQVIEANNVTDLAFGTAGAATVSISFWVRSSITGTFVATVLNDDSTRSYPATYTINSANTWEYKTLTVAGDTAGTWVTTGTAGSIKLRFDLGAGSSGYATANTWQSSSGWSVSGSASSTFAAQSGATWYVTGVQLEKGTQATSFDFRSYGTELALCQRYYYTATASAMGCLSATKTFFGYWALPTSMRTKPSVAQSGTVTVYGVNFADFGTSNPALNTDFGVSGGVVNFSGASTAGGSVGLGAWVYGSGTLQFSAEL